MLEVADEEKGQEIIHWLSDFPLAVRQFLTVANDNFIH